MKPQAAPRRLWVGSTKRVAEFAYIRFDQVL